FPPHIAAATDNTHAHHSMFSLSSYCSYMLSANVDRDDSMPTLKIPPAHCFSWLSALAASRHVPGAGAQGLRWLAALAEIPHHPPAGRALAQSPWGTHGFPPGWLSPSRHIPDPPLLRPRRARLPGDSPHYPSRGRRAAGGRPIGGSAPPSRRVPPQAA